MADDNKNSGKYKLVAVFATALSIGIGIGRYIIPKQKRRYEDAIEFVSNFRKHVKENFGDVKLLEYLDAFEHYLADRKYREENK